MRPHGRARVDPQNPQAFAVCDRCRMLYNHTDLRWQYQYRGNSLMNIRLLVCERCLDKPHEFTRPVILPPDPVPIPYPRPDNYASAEGPPPHNVYVQQLVDEDEPPLPMPPVGLPPRGPFSNPAPGAAMATWPLDGAPGSVAALGLRRLLTSWTGPALNLRRASDGARQDILFTPSGDLDAFGVQAFLGSSTGWIAAWYDQSGHRNHAVQATNAQQPQLVLNATPTGRAAILWTGSLGGQNLQIASSASIDDWFDGGGYVALTSRVNSGGPNGFGRIFSKGELTVVENFGAGVVDYVLDKSFSGTAGQWYAEQDTPYGYGEWYTFAAWYNDSVITAPALRLYGAGTGTFFAPATPSGTRNSDAGQALTIGNRAALDRSWDGDFTEMVIWRGSSPAPSAAAPSIELSMRGYYGTN